MKYLFILSFFLCSCGPFGDCDSIAEYLKQDECLLIVKKIPSETDDIFNYRGTNPETKKECDCNSYTSDKWWGGFKIVMIGLQALTVLKELIYINL